ncbi:C-type lectin 37Db-like isoform X2 [Ptychodera flava]|uniref:C-type lectin 37Db-like isoform X2 n=1 Tax=Ptychodera flava TaxID=63121 RepID=UPI00396A4BF7
MNAAIILLVVIAVNQAYAVIFVTIRRCECYKYTAVCSQSNWDDAKTSCEGDGGWLATMDTQELWEQLQTSIDDANMDKKSCHGNGFWIGFHDPDRSLDGSTHDETAFEWIYPMCESFVTWAAGQPNDNKKHDDSGQNCVQLWTKKDFAYDDEYCTSEKGYICQKKLTLCNCAGS